MILAGWLLAASLAVGADRLEEMAAAGQWDDIVVLASERLEAQPSDEVARFWLGRAWIVRGEELSAGSPGRFARDLARSNFTRAIDALGAVSVISPLYPDASDWRSYARFRRDDEDLAADMERDWAENARGYPAYIRGLIARREGSDDAVVWFRRATEAGLATADVRVALTDELGRQGRVEEGLAAWESARAAGVDAAVLAASLMALLPAESQAEQRLSRLASLEGEPGDAVIAWYRAHALDSLGRTAEAEALMRAANLGRNAEIERFHAHLLIRLGRHDEALSRLTPWVEATDADAIEMVVDLADWLGLAQRWSEAVSAYDLVLGHQSSHERAARNRALTLSRAGREGEAFRAWEQLVASYSRRADVLNDAALMYDGAGSPDRARALWEQALSLGQPGSAAENLAAFMLDAEPERALDLLEQVVATDPTRDRALYLRKQARRMHLR